MDPIDQAQSAQTNAAPPAEWLAEVAVAALGAAAKVAACMDPTDTLEFVRTLGALTGWGAGAAGVVVAAAVVVASVVVVVAAGDPMDSPKFVQTKLVRAERVVGVVDPQEFAQMNLAQVGSVSEVAAAAALTFVVVRTEAAEWPAVVVVGDPVEEIVAVACMGPTVHLRLARTTGAPAE